MDDAHYESSAVTRDGWPFESVDQIVVLSERLHRLIADAGGGGEVRMRISVTQQNVTRRAQTADELRALGDWVDLDVADTVGIHVYHELESGSRTLEVRCGATSLGRGGKHDWDSDEVRLFTYATVEARAERALLGPGLLGQVETELDRAFRRKLPPPVVPLEVNVSASAPLPVAAGEQERWYARPLALALITGGLGIVAVLLGVLLSR